MGVLIDGKWSDGELPQETSQIRPIQTRRQRVPRPHHSGRLVGFQGRTWPLSSLCRARLPLGASYADLSRRKEARGAHFCCLLYSRSQAEWLDLRARPALSGLHSRRGKWLPLPVRSLCCQQSGLYRQGHGPNILGQEDEADRQQRVVRDHPDAQYRIQRDHRRSHRSLSAGPSAEIDAVNERIYHNVNNGVYRAGFAKTQAAYEEAYDGLFETLDWLETRLSRQRYLVGGQITEADWRLFRLWCASMSPISRCSNATGSASPITRTCRTTCASSTGCRVSPTR